MRLFLLSLAFLLFSSAAISQTSLLKNFGFEYGNLLNWKCFRCSNFTIPSSMTNNTTPLTGYNTTVSDLYTGNTYYVAGTAAKTGYIRPTSLNQKNDKYGNYPVVCPFTGAGKHSLKLGDDSLSSVCQGVQYNIKIPASANRYKIVFYYAIDLEDPGTHECWEMPFFNVSAFDSANNNVVIPCSQLDVDICAVKNDPTLWGNWQKSKTLSYGNGDTVYYIGWTPSTIIAKNMGGRTLTLQFTSAGCSPAYGIPGPGSPGSHFGYAYVDLDTTVAAYNTDTLKYCKPDTCFSYTPPPGYKGYRIIDSATGNQLAIDTNHCLTCTPVMQMCGVNLPKPKTTIQVILTPYSGFGCIDTITYFIDTFHTNLLPPIIAPMDSICSGFNMTLTDATGGGLWVSKDTTTATINTSGLFTGLKNGPDSITYFAKNIYGCPDTTYKSFFVVGHSILPILGKNGVCIGDTIHLTDSTFNGTWFVDNSSIATIDQTGVLTGVSYGVSNVKYTFTNYYGCKDSALKAIQVGIPPLQPIVGSNVLCVKHTDSLSNSTINGTWLSTNTAVATISATGVVTGVTAGTTVIKYTISFSGCSDSIKLPITVNAPVITQITGSNTVCQKHTIQLSNSSAGGTWESLNTSIAGVSTSGVITPGKAGTDTIRYLLPVSNGCYDSVFTVVTVNPTPVIGAIAGPSILCFGVPAQFTDTTVGGVWTSSDTSKVKINTNGQIIYVAPGTVTLKYIVTNSAGCSDSVNTIFTVNPIPVVNPINGANSVCQHHTIQLTTTSTNGNWVSSNGNAIVNNGLITPVKPGLDTIKYIIVLPGGCSDSAIKVITVNPAPIIGAISGPSSLCFGVPAKFTDTTAGGTWVSLDNTVFGINSNGVVQEVKPGTATIRYIVTNSAGCIDSVATSFTINPIPSVNNIMGTSSICTGGTSVLSNTTPGGVWSTSNNTVASISGTTVTGNTGGTATITYTVTAAGCSDSATLPFTVVNYPVMQPIIGDSVICTGQSAVLSDATSNGVWSISNTAVATIASNGTVTPVSTGNAIVTYKVSVPPGCADSIKYNIRINTFTIGLAASPVSTSATPLFPLAPVSVTINNVSTNNYSVIAWTPSFNFSNQTATSQSFIADSNVTVCIIAKDNAGGCVDTNCVQIFVTPLNVTIFVPNVINISSSNHLNNHVEVIPTPKNSLKALDFRVYNQWGEMIFHTTDVNGAWDGTASGTVQPIGVYVYVVKATTLDGKIINKKGSITLVK